jgi:hypothetical protein
MRSSAGRFRPSSRAEHDRLAIARSFVRARRGQPVGDNLLELSRRDGQVVRVRLYGGVLLDRDGKPMSVGLQAST